MTLRFRHHLYSCIIIFLMVSCTPVEKIIRSADNAAAIGEYAVAARLYKRAYAKIPPKEKKARGRLSFRQGECYKKYGNVVRARGAYLNALRYHYPDSTLRLRLSEAERIMGNPHGAKKQLEALLADTAITDTLIRNVALRYLNNLDRTSNFRKEESIYTVKQTNIFNTGRSDYCATYLPPDNNIIVFTTTSRKAQGEDKSGITELKAGDLFGIKQDKKGKWGLPSSLEGVNTKNDEGACCFDVKGKTMYFTVCRSDSKYPRMAEIWTSHRSDAKWSKPEQLKITRDTLSNYAHPALSPDGKFLYFVSDMPGGYGGLDLWRIAMENGKPIGGAENLGPKFNTVGDEMFPTFRQNGDLFFSSNGRTPSYGGLDLYKVPRRMLAKKEDRADEEYMKMMAQWRLNPAHRDTLGVLHLPYPLNSEGDDFYLAFKGSTTSGLLSSSRATRGRGWDRIYEFTYPENLLKVKGWVYEQDGYELPQALVYVVGSDGSYERMSVHSDGSFELPLRVGIDYLFLATCKGFLNHQEQLRLDTISINDIKDVKEYTLQFPLASLNHPVLVRGVFYKFDDSSIVEQSLPALERLAELLKENPHVAIALSSHTDSRGSGEYNKKLSERRAKSVVDYLIAHGVAPERLQAVGYGESRPMVVSKKICEQFKFLHEGDTLSARYIATLPEEYRETAHALNRRTAFSVTRTSYGLFDEKGRLKIKVLEKSLRRKVAKRNDLPYRSDNDEEYYYYEE